MNISSLATANNAEALTSGKAQATLAVREKAQNAAKNPDLNADSVEISDDAHTLYAKMQDQTEKLAVNSAGDGGEDGVEAASPEAAENAGAENAENGGEDSDGGLVDADAQDATQGPSPQDLKKKIGKLKQELRTLTGKEGSENDNYIQNKIRKIKSQIANYQAQQNS